MATDVQIRQISRSRLKQIFKDDDLVRLFEAMLEASRSTTPDAIEQVQENLDDHINDSADAHPATAISNTPAGTIVATTVQAAINELDGDVVGVAADLVAVVAGLGSMSSQNANAVNITGGSIALASGSFGYATGNGGTVVQAVSKATGVTLDEPSGEITMDVANLAADTAVQFTLTNSTISAGDRLILNHVAAGTFGAYHLDARAAAGSAEVVVRNLTAGALAEAIVLGFTVVKSATS